VVALEYEVHGESVPTGRPYDNRFVSITTVRDSKVTRWRDYLDPIAIFDAAGGPSSSREQGSWLKRASLFETAQAGAPVPPGRVSRNTRRADAAADCACSAGCSAWTGRGGAAGGFEAGDLGV
jgi:hypothetical protein